MFISPDCSLSLGGFYTRGQIYIFFREEKQKVGREVH